MRLMYCISAERYQLVTGIDAMTVASRSGEYAASLCMILHSRRCRFIETHGVYDSTVLTR